MNRMNEATIIQSLEEAYNGLDLWFQVIYQHQTLYICIDRHADQTLDYDTLIRICRATVSPLVPLETQAMMLLSRVVGQSEPDWQTAIQLILPDEAVSQPQRKATGDPQPQGEVEAAAEQEVLEPALAAASDPSIPLGITEVHPIAAAPSEEVLPEPSATPILSIANPKVAELTTEEAPIDSPATNLSQYCFIHNRALVTAADVLPPEASVAELIQAFHELSDAEKETLLPRLDPILKTQTWTRTPEDSEVIANICTTLTTLSGGEIRKAAIWLSRYCYNPEAALEKISPRLAVATETRTDGVSTAGHSTDNLSPEPISRGFVRRAENAETGYSSVGSTANAHTPYSYNPRPSPQQKPTAKITWQLFVIPLVWILLTLGLVTFNVQANNGSGAIAALCKNAKGAPEYCKLAVQLVGTQTFETYSRQTKPTEESVVEKAAGQCQVKAALNAGGTLQKLMSSNAAQRDKAIPKAFAQHEVYPGLFVFDITTRSFTDSTSEVRTACVFGTLQNKITLNQEPTELANHVIPNQWPQESLKVKPPNLKMAEANSIHGLLALLSTNTLFNAIGLVLVAFFGLGIRIDTLRSLYLAALVFGVVDAAICLIPTIGLFGIIRFTAVPVVALLITSQFIKGLSVDIEEGYRVLALGGGILIGVRFILNWILFAVILSLM